MKKHLHVFAIDSAGAALVEYAILIGLVVTTSVAGVSAIASKSQAAFSVLQSGWTVTTGGGSGEHVLIGPAWLC